MKPRSDTMSEQEDIVQNLPEGIEPGDYAAVCERNIFIENIISALSVRLLIIDEQLNIVLANDEYCRGRGLTKQEVQGRTLDDVFPATILEDAGLRSAIQSTLETGERVKWSGYRHATEDHGERTLNIRLDPVEGCDGRPNVLLTIEDVTERHRQLYERSVLQQIAQAMLGMLELPRLLHAILTGMTAGGAVGLGFNRAILMLVDEEDGLLRAEMGVGPQNASEAMQIWSNVTDDYKSMEDFLEDFDRLPSEDETQLADIVSEIEMPLSASDTLPVSTLYDGRAAHVVNAAEDDRVPPRFHELVGSDEFVLAPLLAKGKRIGVAYADNLISKRPISSADVELFTSLANYAALAIDSAETYAEVERRAEELQEAYQKLEAAREDALRAESLAAIGEMTAIVAHEIRNPLSTIGGFANMMLRQSDDEQKVERNSRIIYDEVGRLENILDGLLAFSHPRQPQFEWRNLCEIINNSIQMVDEEYATRKIKVEVECPDDLHRVYVDGDQIHQVFDNLERNAIEAMEEGGTLSIRIHEEDTAVVCEVSDTGDGIPHSHL
ncbi:MAG: PAS domain-containing protein, partial [Armatimonadota bacterium]